MKARVWEEAPPTWVARIWQRLHGPERVESVEEWETARRRLTQLEEGMQQLTDLEAVDERRRDEEA